MNARTHGLCDAASRADAKQMRELLWTIRTFQKGQ